MEELEVPVDLVQLIRRNARERSDKAAIRVVGERELTWGMVNSRAQVVAGLLSTMVFPGDRVALAFATDVDFLPALLGCWYAGAIPVTVPPGRPGARITQHAGASVTITSEDFVGRVAGQCITVDQAMKEGRIEYSARAINDVALLQYTSGSTGVPKGVVVTHRNYRQNLRMLDEFLRSIGPQIENLQVVSWLPLFHDMGLAMLMCAAFRGGTATLIPARNFVADPGVWLRTIDEVGGNLTGAPNFAFDLCTRRVSAADVAGLDLSSMAVMLNAAESVRPDTVDRFVEHFRPAGLRAEALAPCYGLAEATVFVSGVRYGGRPRTVRFDREALQNGVAAPDDVAGWPMVGCGRRPEGLTVRIVDPESLLECPPGVLGEIWLHGPNVSTDYWHDEAAAPVFAARMSGFDELPYLRTGDRGFLWEGELFVTGRLADLLELQGRRVHAEDVEHTVERSDATLHGRRVAVVPHGEKDDELALAVEIRASLPLGAARRQEIEGAIRAAVTAEHHLDIAEVVFLRPGSLPVTTSGKVQRAKTRALLNQKGLS
jgi:acyl-CoA synthetase (AMP-forming)/AMP-acid ligase II